MRKGYTLQEVNKYNKKKFVPKENLFLNGGDTWQQLAQKKYPLDSAILASQGIDPGQYYSQTKNVFGITKAANPFSKGNIGNTAAGLSTAVAPIAGNLISDGYNSGAGNTIGTVGSMAGTAISAVNPVAGAIVNLGSQVVGGLVNRAFGTKVDEARLNAAKQGTVQLNSFTSNAGSFDDVHGVQAVANVQDAYKDGWFSNKAGKKNKELRQQRENALAFAQNSILNNINNISEDQLNNALSNYAAFGGPLEQINNDNMGAIGYGFMSDYLDTKKKQAEQKEKLTNMFMGTPSGLFADGGGIHIKPSHRGRLTELKERTGKTEAELYNDGNPAHKKMVVFARNARKFKHSDGGPLNLFYQQDTPLFAFGGDMQTNGADFGTGLTHVDAGSSHELNPYDGVQMGVDPEGTPNLVEEGEVVFNDYVYSQRINMSPEAKAKFRLPKKKDITYADAAKKLEKEIAERPNDPISQAGFNAQMQALAEEQERQKAEMEAERAKAAFEALSPEEQTAIMQRAAQEEAMAQQASQQEALAAQQQAFNEEQVALNQQQEAAMSQPEVMGQEPAIMAEGGHLFPWGGLKELFGIKPPYAASNTAGFIPYSRDKQYDEKSVIEMEKDPTFVAWTNYVNDNWDTDEVQSYLRDLDAAAGGNHLFDKEGKILPKAKDYFNHARTGNHKWGYYHLTPQQLAEETSKEAAVEKAAEPRVFHALEGDDDYIQGELSPEVGAETRRVTLDNGDTVIYHDRVPNKGKTPAEVAAETGVSEREIAPTHKAEWLRYAGLFGPAAGLGLQLAGVGKPDYSELNAALESSSDVALADYKPLGNYLTYRPMDIWFEQAKMDANARATDRAIMNNASPIGTKMAGLLASGYNSQLADGELYRKALEYNDAKRAQVAEFNRGTDQFNADAYNRLSQFNASALNQGRNARASLALQAAREKLDADAGWYNSLYGNLSGLFKGISDVGKKNAQHNMIAKMAANGLFGTATPETEIFQGYLKPKKQNKKACGGKMKGKKGKRGLTF